MLFVIVRWYKVDHGVDETQDETLSGPADYDIDCPIVIVKCDLVAITPLRKGACVAEETANP